MSKSEFVNIGTNFQGFIQMKTWLTLKDLSYFVSYVLVSRQHILENIMSGIQINLAQNQFFANYKIFTL